jgi:hypothetical protein
MNISAAGFFATSLFVPVVDGEFIVQRPTLSLAQGKVNGVWFFTFFGIPIKGPSSIVEGPPLRNQCV